MMNRSHIMQIGCLFMLLLTFGACHPKTDIGTLRKELIKLHDRVMDEDDQAMVAKMALDSINKTKSASADSSMVLSEKLDAISEHMMDWMHQFNPELHTKSEDEAIGYLDDQKRQLLQLDSSYKSLLNAAGSYLKKQNIKVKTNMRDMKM